MASTRHAVRLLPALLLLSGSAASLVAADPGWRSKPTSDWTEDDARQVLAGSPWSKEIKAIVTRRLTELKSHEPEPPPLDGDGYRVAVYGIPGANYKGDPIQLGEPFKNLAALKREGKKDVKPIGVEVFQLERSVVVVYQFPLSAEITRQDGQVQFEAQIGRIVVNQNFMLSEMEFMGKLEL